ncbi:MAG: response regulator [Gammaproteobacteria bacterium]|nr:response regulator [Gammaproteobacteria bacterium]
MLNLAMSDAVPERTVLVVDDNVQWGECLREYFEMEGFEVLLAENGKVALEILGNHRPSIIFTDMIMPETEGFEFIIAVRRMDKDIPIIAMSGGLIGRAEYYLDVAKKAGANFCLDKPFSWATLEEVLGKFLPAGK